MLSYPERLASGALRAARLASPRLASPRLTSPIAAASPIATATAAPRQDQSALPQSQLDLSSISTISSNLQPPAISSPSPPHSAPWPDLGPERESRYARVRVKGQGQGSGLRVRVKSQGQGQGSSIRGLTVLGARAKVSVRAVLGLGLRSGLA